MKHLCSCISNEINGNSKLQNDGDLLIMPQTDIENEKLIETMILLLQPYNKQQKIDGK